MAEQLKWPRLPKDPGGDANNTFKRDVAKQLFQAKLDDIKAQKQAQLDDLKAQQQALLDKEKALEVTIEERRKAAWANEYALYQEVHKGYIEVAKGQIDRSVQRAEFVQKMATAVSGLYMAVLGVSFSLSTENIAEGVIPVPASGLIPTFFLALSIFLATVYVSYITDINEVEQVPSGDGSLLSKQIRRRDIFIVWNKLVTLRRKHFLQAAVISLGFGVFYLPLPFLVQDGLTIGVIVLAILSILFTLGFLFWPRQGSRKHSRSK